MDELLTPKEIAEELRVTSETVRAWCRSGRLNATRAGWSYRIKRSDLDIFLKKSKEDLKKVDGLAAFAS